uniref:C2 domain-containing protein n=1 Tax=Macrostomum lignano TaxID=282301 RepID=A0A1I8FUG8_9PLAT
MRRRCHPVAVDAIEIGRGRPRRNGAADARWEQLRGRSYSKSTAPGGMRASPRVAISLGSSMRLSSFAIPRELVRQHRHGLLHHEEKVQLDNLLQRLLAARRQDERRRELSDRAAPACLNCLSAESCAASCMHHGPGEPGGKPERTARPAVQPVRAVRLRLYMVHRRYVCNRGATWPARSCVTLCTAANLSAAACRLEVLNARQSERLVHEGPRQRSGGRGVVGGQDIPACARLGRERQRPEAEKQLKDKKGRKDQKGQEGRAARRPPPPPAASAAESTSKSHPVQPPSPSRRTTPLSMAGQNLDELDNGGILIEQAMRAGSFGSTPGSELGGFRQPRRGGNLMMADTASRESLASNVSENEGLLLSRSGASGEVEVNLQYNYKERRFHHGNPPNPYVKTYLLPDKTKRQAADPDQEGTANPIYSEQLVYDIVKSELETGLCRCLLWHSLTFGSKRIPWARPHRHGELPLRRRASGASIIWVGELKFPCRCRPLMYRGDIMLALRYVSGS